MTEKKSQRYQFFQHRDCEYFPCHKGVPEESFNCLFCYCPLYALGCDCGGDFTLTETGVKNCTPCSIPHQKANYPVIVAKTKLLVERVRDEELSGRRDKS
jgi:Zn-finger protein